ncbi:hypothetical protein MMC17_009200 [Xylographa soralifera]|nr:hypothetical protein [Xylographa soralifera]
MTSSTGHEAYMLYHRRDQIEEEQRLDLQHEIVTNAVFGGQLIYPPVSLSEIKDAIADVGCGTGVWLNDLARTHFADRLKLRPPTLVGFDVNAKAFTKTPEPGVQLVEHDCTKPFADRYHGRFDLVNMRALAYAVPEEGFYRLVANAVQLLRPGGYLQWGESESKLWKAVLQSQETGPDKAITESEEIKRSLEIVADERSARMLVPYLPNFMIRSLIRLPPEKQALAITHDYDAMNIIYFELRPGGASKSSEGELDAKWTDAFSKLTLEATKLLLSAARMRKEAANKNEGHDNETETWEQDSVTKIKSLQSYIDGAIARGDMKMGGVFPTLVARKATSQR